MAETFSDRLRGRRIELGLTQEALARRTTLGMLTVSRLERNRKSSPRLETVEELARALEVDPAWLAWGDTKKVAA